MYESAADVPISQLIDAIAKCSETQREVWKCALQTLKRNVGRREGNEISGSPAPWHVYFHRLCNRLIYKTRRLGGITKWRADGASLNEISRTDLIQFNVKASRVIFPLVCCSHCSTKGFEQAAASLFYRGADHGENSRIRREASWTRW